ncbi:MAG: YfiR family protein, partial [Steroidobacteraceae bacterium]
LGMCALLWLSVLPDRVAAADTYSAEAVEAAFLYRFIGYVNWPPQPAPDAPFTIAVLDDDAVARELQLLIGKRPVQNRVAQVRTIRNIKDLDGAQMLYIGVAHNDDLRRLIAPLAGRPVLIVTNAPDGLEAGGSVNFLLIDHRVRFEISLDASQSAGLRISSELLAVAIRVRGRRVFLEPGCESAISEAASAPCIREAASW